MPLGHAGTTLYFGFQPGGPMRIWLAIGAALLAAACSHAQKPLPKVDDSGLARLNEQQMGPVDDARVEEGRANDAVARARLEVAKSEKDVSAAQLKRAQAELDLLKKQYAPKDSIARADQDIKAAQQRIQATDLKLQYLTQLIGVAESERKAA